MVDQSNWRIASFLVSSGSFLRAWGSGVLNGAGELQTCTSSSSCRRGPSPFEESPPYVTGGIPFGDGVAVDGESGDVYVTVRGTDRVEKFGPEGEFLFTFGGEVNKKTKADVCVVGEECQQGVLGSGNGQFQELGPVAVGPGGLVYVGDRARVQIFDGSGAFKEAISLAGLSSAGAPSSLAVDSAGDVFVVDSGVAGVHEFQLVGGKWSESAACKLDQASLSIASIAVDGSGDVFVGETNGGSPFGFHVLEYDSSCEQVGEFGSGTVRGGSVELVEHKQIPKEFLRNGMAFSETSGKPELYVSEYYEERPEHIGELTNDYSSVWALPVPPPGPPVIEEESAKPGPRGSVSLEATINPSNLPTEHHFEYVSEAEFTKMVGGKECEWVCASRTGEGSLPASFKGVSVSVPVTGLAVSTVYRYRAIASSKAGETIGEGKTFQTLPAAYLESEYVTDVASNSATIDAQVDPLGSSTKYRVEYGTSVPYEHEVSGTAGEGVGSVLVEVHQQDLAPATTYHYRVVLENELGTLEGVDRTFTTEPPGGVLTLPDGRAWELVSPADKKGVLIEPTYPGAYGGSLQAARGGSGIAYVTMGPALGEGARGKLQWSQALSVRGAPGVWRTEDLTLPLRLPENEAKAEQIAENRPEYNLFSEDLSLAAVEPQPDGTPSLSSEASERTLYRRDAASGSFAALVTCADILSPCPKFGGDEAGAKGSPAEEMHLVAATPDLSYVVLDSPFALTPEAHESYFSGHDQWNLYEWGGGRLQLVNVLPDGEATQGVSPYVRLAQGSDVEGHPDGTIPSAVSADGRRVAWDVGVPYDDREWSLYVRDMVEGKTVQVGGSQAVFQWMSSDGSKVFYLEGGDLHMCEVGTNAASGKLECALSDLTAVHGTVKGEVGAGVQEIVSDVSSDGSYVYFVATSVLANLNGPVSGEDNLYVLHDSGGKWSTAFVATLSSEDTKSWKSQDASTRAGHNLELPKVSSRVSPNGRYLAFMSNRSLTGYDNLDAESGRADEEAYLYHAPEDLESGSGTLVCASCNPTGERPHGVLDRPEALLVDREGIWSSKGALTDHWLAASLPGWDWDTFGKGSLYQPRYLSDSGRLFFDSPDELVPQATNGVMNVYEYEPPGEGSCTTAASTYGERSGGCVSLISSGTSGAESAFLDASRNGDDVFFLTVSKLVGADYDNAYDVYDAHVCGSEGVACVTEPTPPLPCSSGDSCKAAPSPQPEIFGPAPSATFSGAGNVVEETKVKGKSRKKAKKRRAKGTTRKAKGKRVRKAGKKRTVRTSGKSGRRSG
ncbi:MAG: hypothetical protein WA484_13365 [Solirubrobacteraceae bacterium]